MLPPITPPDPVYPLRMLRWAWPLVAVGLVLSVPACTPARRQITPTTLGTDLRQLPRGRMIPQPLPGSDLARRSAVPPRDAATALASGPGSR